MRSSIKTPIGFCLFLFLMTGCGGNLKDEINGNLPEIPELRITCQDQTMEYIFAPTDWNGAQYDREPLGGIGFLANEDAIPLVAVGDTITVEWLEAEPPADIIIQMEAVQGDSFPKQELTENWIDSKLKIPLEAVDQTSVNAEETNIRGFLLSCGWKKGRLAGNYCEYYFVVKID